MNSVYVPVHVVVLLRRIVNVISSLSISNQYLLLKQAKADEERAWADARSKSQLVGGVAKPPSQRAFDDTKGAEWPWWGFRDRWDWPRLILVEKVAAEPSRHYESPTRGAVKANSAAFPWIGKNWTWPSLLSTSAYPDTHDSSSRSDPPPPPKPQKDEKSSQKPTRTPLTEPGQKPPPLDTIHQLIRNPALYDPLRTPRYPIVLCHGLYGFDSRGPLTFPSMRMHYWSNVLNILRDTVRAEVIVTSVPGTGSISSRSEALDQQLQHKARGRGINFLAHSMGGLDCRHLISHIRPSEYAPLSLTTISTPHRGSPFMDWCAENIGIGKLRQQERELAKARNMNMPQSTLSDVIPPTNSSSESAKARTEAFSLSLSALPSSFTTLLLSIVDSPAYANLTSSYLNDVFNPATPDDPTVKYFSVAGRMAGVSVWHPFWLPKMVLDGVEEKDRGRLRAIWETSKEGSERNNPLWAQEREWGNDGLVTVQSAKWGEFLGIMEGCDHWEMRGARGIEFGVDLPAIPVIGLGVSTSGHRSANGDGWGLRDWSRFVGAWKKEEKIQQDAAAKASGQKVDRSPEGREHEREQQRRRDDAVVKSSTDRLSAVFDWLSEQVPSPSLLGAKAKVIADMKARTSEDVTEARGEVSEMQKHMDKEEKGRRKNELATKLDLERFYVALSKKLYDEGL